MIFCHERLDIYTTSEKNVREHWAKKSKRTRQMRGLVKQALWGRLQEARRAISGGLRLEIRLSRIAPSNGLDASDNLPVALSAVKDGVADALGLRNDEHAQIVWAYDQARSAPRVYAVEIRVESEAP
jgi:hypothetical protein